MIKLEVDEKQINAINDKLNQLNDFFKKKAIAKLADMVYDKADDLADEHTQTGEMLKSLYMRKNSSFSYEIGFDDKKAPYAKFVHFGSKPHEIKIRNRKFLRWSDGDDFIFAKKVNHPGYKGDPFLYEALKSQINPFIAWLDRQIANETN